MLNTGTCPVDPNSPCSLILSQSTENDFKTSGGWIGNLAGRDRRQTLKIWASPLRRRARALIAPIGATEPFVV